MDTPENKKLTGGRVNYYLVRVEHPQREEQEPYTAECEDIIRAAKMTFDEGNEFKAIWRTAMARLGNGKPGQTAKYDAEKRVHYATASLRAEQIADGSYQQPEPKKERGNPRAWKKNNGRVPHEIMDGETPIEANLRYGELWQGKAMHASWQIEHTARDIMEWRYL